MIRFDYFSGQQATRSEIPLNTDGKSVQRRDQLITSHVVKSKLTDCLQNKGNALFSKWLKQSQRIIFNV